MDKQMRKQKIIAYLKAVGAKIKSDEFASRIRAQKLAYILQAVLGEQLYTDFNFYIRGPYSRELAKEYFENAVDFAGGKSDYQVVGEKRAEIERIKPVLDGMSITDLEIAASLLFLRGARGMDEEQAEKELHERKPHLRFDDIWRGTNLVKRILLTEKKRGELMDALNKEMESWDVVSNESLKRFE